MPLSRVLSSSHHPPLHFPCIFTMWKNDRFFEERKVAFSPKIAAALLQSGKVNVKKLYSPKTGKTYDGTIVLADTGGKYVNYRVELPKKK